jgi:cation diffusion facilitator CzcD-associated flavoprotein CzcO
MAAKGAAHVTMLQRSPTYVVTRPAKDALANGLRKLLSEHTAYALTRIKNVAIQRYFYRNARQFPEWSKTYLIDQVRKRLPAGYDVEKHFVPRYAPWDERVCLIPDDDLFEAITAGTVSIVTDRIKRITRQGIELESGQALDADVIVVATGITLKVSGGASFEVDGARVQPEHTLTYKGLMYSDVPNLVWTFGYVNASWTLRADLNAQYACHLINRMQELGMRQCTPRLRPEDRAMPTRPWIDSFTPGYLRRALHLFPKQGDRAPWINTQDYAADKKLLSREAVNDDVLIFDNPKP